MAVSLAAVSTTASFAAEPLAVAVLAVALVLAALILELASAGRRRAKFGIRKFTTLYTYLKQSPEGRSVPQYFVGN